jgi:hypothetical protein
MMNIDVVGKKPWKEALKIVGFGYKRLGIQRRKESPREGFEANFIPLSEAKFDIHL